MAHHVISRCASPARSGREAAIGPVGQCAAGGRTRENRRSGMHPDDSAESTGKRLESPLPGGAGSTAGHHAHQPRAHLGESDLLTSRSGVGAGAQDRTSREPRAGRRRGYSSGASVITGDGRTGRRRDNVADVIFSILPSAEGPVTPPNASFLQSTAACRRYSLSESGPKRSG